MATLVVEVAFALVFCQALVAYARGRDPLQRDVMLVFTAMATIFGLEVWRRALGPPPAWVGGISSVLLLAQPYLTLRLVAALRRVARPLRVAALAGFAVTALPFALGRPMPALVVLAAVAVFVAVETIAAVFLYREARRRSGSPRIRLMAAAAGTAAFAVAILAAGAGAAGPHAAAVAGNVALVVALASGMAYLVAFVPPGWLRRSWSTSAAYATVSSLLQAPAGESPERIWQRYADTVRAVTASDTVVVLLGDRSDGVVEVAARPQPANSDVAYPSRQLEELFAAPQPVAVPAGSAPRARRRLGLAGGRTLRDGPCRSGCAPAGTARWSCSTPTAGCSPTTTWRCSGELGSQAGIIADRGSALAEQERPTPPGRLRAPFAGQPGQERLPGQHEPRTPYPAQRDHRLQRTDGRAETPTATTRMVPLDWIATSTAAAGTCSI